MRIIPMDGLSDCYVLLGFVCVSEAKLNFNNITCKMQYILLKFYSVWHSCNSE